MLDPKAQKDFDRILKLVEKLPDELRVKIVSKILHDFFAETSAETLFITHKEPDKRCPLSLVVSHKGLGMVNMSAAFHSMIKLTSNPIPKVHEISKEFLKDKDWPVKFRQSIKTAVGGVTGYKGQILENPDTRNSKNILFLAHRLEDDSLIDQLFDAIFNTKHETHNPQQPNDDSESSAEQPDGTGRSPDREAFDPELNRTNHVHECRGSNRPEHGSIPPAGPEVSDSSTPPPSDQSDGTSQGESSQAKGTIGPEDDIPF